MDAGIDSQAAKVSEHSSKQLERATKQSATHRDTNQEQLCAFSNLIALSAPSFTEMGEKCMGLLKVQN